MIDVDALVLEASRYSMPRAATVRPSTPRWSLTASAEDARAPADLYLYDQIGFPGIEAREVVEQVRAHGQRPLRVHINSPGGDVFGGLAIHNLLRQHSAPVQVRVEGLAASIASVIAMSGSTLRMARASLLMIHEPHAFVVGNAHDMRHMAQLLDKAGGLMAEVYARRGADRERIRSWMHAETWWTAAGALEARMIDAIDDEPLPADAIAVQAAFDLSAFKNPPATPAPPADKPSPRVREQTRLLAAGFDYLMGDRQ